MPTHKGQEEVIIPPAEDNFFLKLAQVTIRSCSNIRSNMSDSELSDTYGPEAEKKSKPPTFTIPPMHVGPPLRNKAQTFVCNFTELCNEA